MKLFLVFSDSSVDVGIWKICNHCTSAVPLLLEWWCLKLNMGYEYLDRIEKKHLTFLSDFGLDPIIQNMY